MQSVRYCFQHGPWVLWSQTLEINCRLKCIFLKFGILEKIDNNHDFVIILNVQDIPENIRRVGSYDKGRATNHPGYTPGSVADETYTMRKKWVSGVRGQPPLIRIYATLVQKSCWKDSEEFFAIYNIFLCSICMQSQESDTHTKSITLSGMGKVWKNNRWIFWKYHYIYRKQVPLHLHWGAKQAQFLPCTFLVGTELCTAWVVSLALWVQQQNNLNCKNCVCSFFCKTHQMDCRKMSKLQADICPWRTSWQPWRWHCTQRCWCSSPWWAWT